MRGRQRHHLPGGRKGAVALLTAIVVAAGLVLAGPAFAANSTVTAATGGTGVSMDKTSASGGSGAWSALTGPVVTENSDGNIHTGTVTLTAPTGFEFDTASTVTVAIGNSNPNATKVRTTSCGSGSQSASATVTASTISINVCQASSSGKNSTMTWSGIQVRPTASSGTPSGNILSSGATITGVTAGTTSFGTLSTVAGALDHLVPAPNPATITAGGSQSYTVTGRDRFNNTQTVPAGTTYAITPDGSCTLATCTATTAGSHTVTATNSGKTGTATLTVSAAALHHLVLSPGSATITAGTSQSYTAAGFDQYNNALGDQTAGTTFSIDPNGSCNGGSCSATAAGAHMVTGTNGTATGTASLSVQPAAATNVSVSLAPAAVTANGSATSTATVTVTDSFGNPRTGDAVTVSTNGDAGIGAVTNQGNGTYTATITASTTAGTETITGTDGAVSGTATLTETPGPASGVGVVMAPSSITADGTSTATVTATVSDVHGNPRNGDTVAFSTSGDVSIGAVTDHGDGTYTATVTASTTAGTETITATDGSATGSASLTEIANVTVSSVSPSALGQGADGGQWHQTVVINGTNFVNGAVPDFGPGITVSFTTFVDSTQLKPHIIVSGSATTGTRNVTVTNPDTGVAVCTGCFTVNAAPIVTTVTPNVRGAAWAGTATVTGSNFQPGVKLNFGPSVGVTSLTRIDSQTLTVGLSIAAAAAPGARDVVATNLDAGSSTCSGCFTVTASPTVGAATPASASRGSSGLPVTISGANFVAGATVAINNGGVTITNVAVVDANTITLKVTISSGAATGLRTFTVTNADGGKGSKACFTVT